MKKIVWTNDTPSVDDYIAEYEECTGETISTDTAYYLMADDIEEERNYTAALMDGIAYAGVIVHGDIGRWDGNHSGYKILNSRYYIESADWSDILHAADGFDSIEVYVDDHGDICYRCADHDGHSYFEAHALNTEADGFDEAYDDFTDGSLSLADFVEQYGISIGGDYLKRIGIA